MPMVFMCKNCGAVTDPAESGPGRVKSCDVCRRHVSFYLSWASPGEDAHAAAIIERHRLHFVDGYKRPAGGKSST